jgi:HlyD family secretion protein
MAKTIPYKLIFFFMVGLFFLFMVVRTSLSGPPTTPRPSDVERSLRELPPTKGPDERMTEPSGGPFIVGNGIVEPKDREIQVAGEVSGRIARYLVEEGQQVEAGAVLVELESSAERAALAAAEADVEAKKAELSRVAKGLRAEDVDAVVAEGEAAKARAELSSGTLERTEKLAKGGGATVDELDRARRQAAIDARSADAAEARRKAALAGSRQEDVLVARAALLGAQARRDQAKAAVERLQVKAPITGEILWVKFRGGEYYNTQGAFPLLVMGNTQQLRVRMDADERDVGKLRIGAPAYATLNAFPGEKFAGKVVEIGRRMGRKNIRTDDPAERIDTKILEVVVELAEKDRLVPGLRVLVFVEVERPATASARSL